MHLIGNARINNVCQSQSCVVSNNGTGDPEEGKIVLGPNGETIGLGDGQWMPNELPDPSNTLLPLAADNGGPYDPIFQTKADAQEQAVGDEDGSVLLAAAENVQQQSILVPVLASGGGEAAASSASAQPPPGTLPPPPEDSSSRSANKM